MCVRDNWNPIFYRTDKYELVECGHRVYEKGTEYDYPGAEGEKSHFRTMTWAVLKSKESGLIVTVINTHFDTDAANLKSESDELLAKAEALRAAYGNNVFVIGDYNDRIGGTACRNLLANGFADTFAMAQTKNETSGTHGTPTYNASAGKFDTYDGVFTSSSYQNGAIDHCLTMNQNATVRNYRIITSKDALLISDHCPVWVRAYL